MTDQELYKFFWHCSMAAVSDDREAREYYYYRYKEILENDFKDDQYRFAEMKRKVIKEFNELRKKKGLPLLI